MGDGPVIAFNVKTTAESLQVNPETVRRWIRAGLPALNVGTTERPDYRIEPAKLREWLESGRTTPPADDRA